MLISYINPVIDKLNIIILEEINVKHEEMNLYKLTGFSVISKCRYTKKGGGIAI